MTSYSYISKFRGMAVKFQSSFHKFHGNFKTIYIYNEIYKTFQDVFKDAFLTFLLPAGFYAK